MWIGGKRVNEYCQKSAAQEVACIFIFHVHHISISGHTFLSNSYGFLQLFRGSLSLFPSSAFTHNMYTHLTCFCWPARQGKYTQFEIPKKSGRCATNNKEEAASRKNRDTRREKKKQKSITHACMMWTVWASEVNLYSATKRQSRGRKGERERKRKKINK